MGAIYSIDTSSLIHGWWRAYPPDIFPQVWEQFDNLIEGGELIATMEVYEELQKKDDQLTGWADERKESLFVEIDEDVQEHVAAIMATYPRLVDTRKGLSTADPFVIGLAQCYNDPLTVITQEQGGTAAKPKLEYVCLTEGIRVINLLDMIREQGWRFG